MSVNLTVAIDPTRVKHLGKYFGTIDFDVATAPSKMVFDRLGKSVHVGTLFVSDKKYRMKLEELETLVIDCYHSDPVILFGDEWNLTKKEVDRLVETLKTAKHVFFQRYRLGV